MKEIDNLKIFKSSLMRSQRLDLRKITLSLYKKNKIPSTNISLCNEKFVQDIAITRDEYFA